VRALCFYNSNGSLGWLDTVEPETRGALDVRLGRCRTPASWRSAGQVSRSSSTWRR